MTARISHRAVKPAAEIWAVVCTTSSRPYILHTILEVQTVKCGSLLIGWTEIAFLHCTVLAFVVTTTVKQLKVKKTVQVQMKFTILSVNYSGLSYRIIIFLTMVTTKEKI